MSIQPKKRKMLHSGREKLMLDVRPMLIKKGITNAFTYLRKTVGLPANFCTQLCAGKVYRIPTQYLEQLCVTLNCTPNDLYIYKTPPQETLGENHALAKLYNPTAPNKDLLMRLKSMSPEELDAFYLSIEKQAESTLD